jgi:hypothetical protein
VHLSQSRTQRKSTTELVRRIDRGYENGELIVDTIGFVEHPYSFVDNYRAPHTKALRVVERWKMFGGGNAIEAMVISRRVRCALVGQRAVAESKPPDE